ncbi:ATP-binding cassette domain-containing protein [Thiobaca trueperi]|uniref:FHA modulated ABC efflux pump with fused ATPase and integral membrane subunit n=1 Tax=Thiobaca trueperi TaxID=127458 RepID=A0A4R3N174_9GAMM|nr:ATP-binding cassette domain-containing protein [Thiobaca trueperi]TCT22780.1 FHA modulated ABC efflux pump with fused ATPase and integral membrane subunit [Thiobaca trueperi]
MQQIEFRTSRRSIGRIGLGQNQELMVGSDHAGPLCIAGPAVLPQHARFVCRNEIVWIEPLGTAPLLLNGTPVEQAMAVKDGDWLAFGETLIQIRLPDGAPPVQTAATPRPPSTSTATHSAADIIVGRLPGCGLPIDSPLISREHARLILADDGVWLEDLGSINGTWINGQRVTKPVPLRPGDRVSFASFVFLFSGTALEPAEAGNRVRIAARGLTKTVIDRASGQPRHLLNQIDLVIEPGEFVVIFGTSGSGKSTLMDALNGRRPASSGQVAYNGVDLYRSFDLFRSGIGYVPQQDIVHRKIRMRNALRYTARLRLPPDTTPREIDANIERVLERVGMADKADLAVDTPEPLSGGQLKRVSLAVELVANPNVLFLDEATSGLDAGTDKKMMRLFADLAADGKTVVCVTHTLENIDHCHLVALLHRGCLVYYGPPQQAAAHFGVARLSDVYERLESSKADEWHARFLASEHYARYVRGRLPSNAEPPTPADAAPPTRPRRTRRLRALFDFRQSLTLTRRYLDLLLSDRLNLLVLLLQAPLIALAVGAVFETGGSLPERAAAESQVSFVLVLSAIWFGCINSAREIVKELPVYLRERSVTVRLPAYLVSKLIPLALLCLLQCASFLAIVTWMLGFPGSFGDRLVVLFLAGLAATGMGLAVSAFVNSNDKAIAALPLLLIPQFILSNSVVALSDGTEVFARITVIAYWGLDAMRATLAPEILALHHPDGSPLIRVSGEWASDAAFLGAQTAAFVLLTLIGLKLKDRRI